MGKIQAKKTGMVRRAVAAAFAALLACALVPALAFAEETNVSNSSASTDPNTTETNTDQSLTTGTTSLNSGTSASPTTGSTTTKTTATTKSTKPTTKTVYVLTSAKSKVKGDGYSHTTNTTYTTDAKTGLLTKQTYADATTKNTYNKNKQITKRTEGTSYTKPTTWKYTYSKKGQLTKDSMKGAYSVYQKYSQAYKYNKAGKVSKVVRKDYMGKITYTFYYKKGKLVKVLNSRSSMPLKYAYDKKGNLSKMVSYKGDTSVTIKYKNTYNKKTGNLAKRVSTVQSQYGSTTTTTYKWKAIKVPTAMEKRVKAQQWALLNNNLNFANGGWSW